MLMYCDLWPKKFQNLIVDGSTARNFTVCSNKEGFTIILKTSRRLTFCTVFLSGGQFQQMASFYVLLALDKNRNGYHKALGNLY